MNYIYSDGRFTLTGYVDDGDYPVDKGSNAIIEMTNWPFDAFVINGHNCFVFADPNLMIDNSFVKNEVITERALVLHEQDLYRHSAVKGLQLINEQVLGTTKPIQYHNLGKNHYLYKRHPELYDELFTALKQIKDMDVDKDYMARRLQQFLRQFVERIPFVHLVIINHSTNEVAHAYTQRLDDGKYKHVLQKH